MTEFKETLPYTLLNTHCMLGAALFSGGIAVNKPDSYPRGIYNLFRLYYVEKLRVCSVGQWFSHCALETVI